MSACVHVQRMRSRPNRATQYHAPVWVPLVLDVHVRRRVGLTDLVTRAQVGRRRSRQCSHWVGAPPLRSGRPRCEALLDAMRCAGLRVRSPTARSMRRVINASEGKTARRDLSPLASARVKTRTALKHRRTLVLETVPACVSCGMRAMHAFQRGGRE